HNAGVEGSSPSLSTNRIKKLCAVFEPGIVGRLAVGGIFAPKQPNRLFGACGGRVPDGVCDLKCPGRGEQWGPHPHSYGVVVAPTVRKASNSVVSRARNSRSCASLACALASLASARSANKA